MLENPHLRRIAALLLAAVLMVSTPIGASAFFYEEEDESEEEILAQEEEAPPKNTSPTAQLINGADLNPTGPKSEALDAYLDDLLGEILDDDMDTYEQVKACYDYLVANVSYGSHMSQLGTTVRDGVTCRQIYSSYGEVEGFGAVALTAKQGLCNAYNSAFILMVRKIGLDANLVKGSTRSRGGGWAYHEWTEVTIDGLVYLFDPQLEQDLVRAGLPAYSVFCKTYAESGRYSK